MPDVKLIDRILLTSTLSLTLMGSLFACQGSVPTLATDSSSNSNTASAAQTHMGFMGGGPGERPGGQRYLCCQRQHHV